MIRVARTLSPSAPGACEAPRGGVRAEVVEGAPEAIDVAAFYQRYGPMVLRRCRALLRHEEKAQDAMQETFVRLLRSRHRLTPDAPSSLLFRMATNVCLNMLRTEGRRPEGPGDEILLRIACADDVERRFGAQELLHRIFGKERESTRTIAVLHLVDGMTLEEVAREVGLSVSGVRKRLRALKAYASEREEM